MIKSHILNFFAEVLKLTDSKGWSVSKENVQQIQEYVMEPQNITLLASSAKKLPDDITLYSRYFAALFGRCNPPLSVPQRSIIWTFALSNKCFFKRVFSQWSEDGYERVGTTTRIETGQPGATSL